MSEARELDEYISTNLETSAAIMKAINEILWQEKMQNLMKELALELQRMGVDFSKAQPTENPPSGEVRG
jgi:hypothetical protein